MTHYHSFLQHIQLQDIEDNISTLQTQLSGFKNSLENDTFSLYELQIDYLYNKLDAVMIQLKTLEPNRVKRGLIDGLGSIIKSISGNLDYSDAIRYNNAIKILENSQTDIISEFNSHISLSKEWMNSYSNLISQLVENQSKLNSTLILLLDKDIHKDSNIIKYAKFAQLLTIITENIDDVLGELLKIENSLAFIRTSSTHHSMLNADSIARMIKKLREIYFKEQVIDLELRQYYDIIKPGYYYHGKQIVLVFKIPIASIESFDLFRLAVFPNRNMQALFPPSPYILTNRHTFLYMEAECPKYNNEWYLCEGRNNQLRTSSDCVQSLIQNQTMHHTCGMITITLSQEAMEALDERHYILSFPHPTQAHTTCEREDFITLNGSFLATIPVGCTLQAGGFSISNSEDKITGQPLRIQSIKSFEMDLPSNPNRMDLKSIDLGNLHSIQNKVMLQPTLDNTQRETSTLYHTTIPFYGTLVAIIALGGSIYTIRRRRKLPKLDPENQERSSGEAQEQFPATFHHPVLK